MAAAKSPRSKAGVSKKKGAVGSPGRATEAKASEGSEHSMREHLLALLEEVEELGEDLLQQIGKRLTELRAKAMGRVAAPKKKVVAKKRRPAARKKSAPKKATPKKAARKKATAKKTARTRAVATTRRAPKKSSATTKSSTRKSAAKKAGSRGASTPA